MPLRGKQRCRCAYSTLFALRAKALQSGAPDHGWFTGKSILRGDLPIGKLSRRAGGRGNGLLPARGGVFPAHRQLHALPTSLSPQETEIRAISQTKRAPSSQKPSAFIFIHPQQTRPVTSRASSLTFRGEHPAHAQAQLSALQIPSTVCAASAFGASPCCMPHRDDSPSSLDFFSTPG